MKQTVKVGEKSVTFKCIGSTPFLYRSLHGKDFFKDLVKLEQSMSKDMANVDIDTVYNIAYTFAYENDKEIGNMVEWLSGFEDGFPILEILAELQDLLKSNLQSINTQRVNKKKVVK